MEHKDGGRANGVRHPGRECAVCSRWTPAGPSIRPAPWPSTGSTIVAVGPEREVTQAYRGRRVIDARGGVVHPGFVDGHCHVTIHLGRGAVPDDPGVKNGFGYADWFNHLGDGDEYVQTQCAAVEMLRNGYTCFLEPGTAFRAGRRGRGRGSRRGPRIGGGPVPLGRPRRWNALVAPMANRAPCDRAAGPRAPGRTDLAEQGRRAADPRPRRRCTDPARSLKS